MVYLLIALYALISYIAVLISFKIGRRFERDEIVRRLIERELQIVKVEKKEEE